MIHVKNIIKNNELPILPRVYSPVVSTILRAILVVVQPSLHRHEACLELVHSPQWDTGKECHQNLLPDFQ